VSKRRYLTGKEVQAMMQAVCYGATGARDYCLILLAYRHGDAYLVNCLICIYQDLDLNEGRINIRRLKNGFSTVHRYVLMSVKPWNAGPRNVLTGKALTGPTLYLFLAAGAVFSPAGLSHYSRCRY